MSSSLSDQFGFITKCKWLLSFHAGTMSGGGTKVSRGRMGSSVLTEVDPRELYKMEQELDEVLN